MTVRPRVLLTTAAAAMLMGGLAGPTLAAEPATESSAGATGLGSADGVRYKKATTQIPGDPMSYATDGHVRARCDAGWKAVSGGQSIGVKDNHTIADSGVEEPRNFYVSAWQADDAPATLTGYAVCLRTSGLTTEAVGEFNVPGNSQVTDTAWCAEGHAVGGGLTVIGEESDFALNASSPVDSPDDADTRPDDGWRAYTHYAGAGGSGEGAVFSVACLAGPSPAYRTRTVTVPDGEAAYGSARCPKGKTVIGGGIYIDGEAIASHVVASRPWDSADAGKVPDDGWRAGVVSNSHDDLTMTVHAICR